ncbi:unnamed protein product [Moneuplotes crassus]|uniref:Uncharacterized protein n=1 Tax=Euplotes crassus TaxID=5936 RepID=A0AAD1U697_EUPCR|nr:unnamed protein product [Moneuplotes crassus]
MPPKANSRLQRSNLAERSLLNEEEKVYLNVQRAYRFGIVILAIANFIASWIASSGISSYTASLRDLEENWSQRPIVDIQAVQGTCPQGYEPLIQDEWPGTIGGCDCSDTWAFYYSDLDRGYCSRNQTRVGCKHVNERPPVPLTTFYSYKICAKREGEPFYKAERPSSHFGDSSCPYGYQSCGNGDAKERYCVKEGSLCPVNNIKIGKSSYEFSDDYKTIQLDSEVVLGFTNTSNSLAISRINIAEGNICADPEESDVTEGRKIYLLSERSSSQCSNKIAGETIDPRYEELGIIREDRLYQDNGVTKETQGLPNYPTEDSENYYWNLYQNRFFQWHPDCDGAAGLSKVDIISLIDNSMDVPGSLSTVFWQCLIFLCIVLALLLIYFCVSAPTNKSEVDCLKIFEYVSVFTKLCLIIIVIYYWFSTISTINSFSSVVYQIGVSQCSDEFTDKIFMSYSTTLGSSNGKNYFSLVTSIIVLLTCGAYAVLLFIGKFNAFFRPVNKPHKADYSIVELQNANSSSSSD